MASSVKPGQPAPDFTLRDAYGRQIALSSFQGRPVVVNFFKSTCPYCQDEMPRLQRVYDKHTGSPVRLLGVAVGHDTAQEVQRVDDEWGLKLPLVIDQDHSVREAYGLRLVPTLVFIDAEGKVLDTWEGSADGLARAVDQALDALAKGGQMPRYTVTGHGSEP